MLNVKRNTFSDNELVVLMSLQREEETPTTEITEILNSTGIRDNDEVLRALYTLEGKHLVSPDPKGDFTSNRWKITDRGIQALNILSRDN